MEESQQQEVQGPQIDPITAQPYEQPKIDSAKDFPTLGDGPSVPVRNGFSNPNNHSSNGVGSTQQQQQRPTNQTQSISSRIAPTWNAKTKLEDDFPLLAGVSEPVNQNSIKPKPFMNSSRPGPSRPRAAQGPDDFPALPSHNTKVWSGAGYMVTTAKGASKKPAPAPVLPKPEFNYIPLTKTNNHQNGVRAFEPSPPPSPELFRPPPPSSHAQHHPEETSSKNKKKQIALAAAALFNGGNLPSSKNSAAGAGTEQREKVDRRPQNDEEDFPSLQPISSRKAVAKVKAFPKPKSTPPAPRKISPPPGFSLVTSSKADESTSSTSLLSSNIKPPPGFDPIPKHMGGSGSGLKQQNYE